MRGSSLYPQAMKGLSPIPTAWLSCPLCPWHPKTLHYHQSCQKNGVNPLKTLSKLYTEKIRDPLRANQNAHLRWCLPMASHSLSRSPNQACASAVIDKRLRISSWHEAKHNSELRCVWDRTTLFFVPVSIDEPCCSSL